MFDIDNILVPYRLVSRPERVSSDQKERLQRMFVLLCDDSAWGKVGKMDFMKILSTNENEKRKRYLWV